jgi:asparagine synthase (glutamine-hydrolysing)
MCGICGVVSVSPDPPLTRGGLERMRDILLHRGPDGAGLHLGPHVALGHRRLSIVDVAHGSQPMQSEDGRYVLSYNGEIFNHPELKPRLEAQGVRYRTRSDTETLLHLCIAQGERAVEQARGMFAFALWDTHERKLVLGRDRFGVKPLYYSLHADGTLYFASEIKAILAVRGGRPALNHAALPDYLANHAPSGEQTLYEGILRLPAGHTLEWSGGKIALRKYWDLPDPASAQAADHGGLTDASVVAEFRDRLEHAVRIRLMSDVPLGVFLSGGIDSAAITALMSKMVPDQIQSFSVAFQEREANELVYSRLVSERFGTKRHEILISPGDFFRELPRLVWHEDEPLAHPSSVALYFVSKLAAEHVKVVLSGEGSDELLAGYNRYRVTSWNLALGRMYGGVVPRGLRGAFRGAIRGRARHSPRWAKVGRTFLGREPDLDSLYFDNFAVFDREAIPRLLTDSALERVRGIDPYAAYHAAIAHRRSSSLLSQLLYADAKTYLHELLMKQDQMSMAASLESRVPFLDHPLAEWVTGLPDRFKLRGGTTKWVLRQAMRDLLPEEILARGKMGFPVPIGSWLRGPWQKVTQEFLLSPRATGRGLFAPEYLASLVTEHQRGLNHSERLWSLVNFEMWCRIFLEGDDPETVARAS